MYFYFEPSDKQGCKSSIDLTEESVADMMLSIVNLTKTKKDRFKTELNKEIRSIIDGYLDIEDGEKKDYMLYMFSTLCENKKKKWLTKIEKKIMGDDIFYLVKIGPKKDPWEYSVFIYTFCDNPPPERMFNM